MKTTIPWKKTAVLAVLATGVLLVDGEKPASAQVIYEQGYVPAGYQVQVRGLFRRRLVLRPVGVAPVVVAPRVVTSAPGALTETRYVTTPAFAETRYVTTPAFAETRYVTSTPVVERSYTPTSEVVPAQYIVPFGRPGHCPAVMRVR